MDARTELTLAQTTLAFWRRKRGDTPRHLRNWVCASLDRVWGAQHRVEMERAHDTLPPNLNGA